MSDDVLGTAEGEPVADPGVETAPASDTATPPAGATDPTPSDPESFVDPSTLPPELKAHWRRMHGAYTKRLEEIRARKADTDLVDRYRSDAEFARQFLASEAARLGLTLGGAPTPAPAPTPAATPGGIAPELVAAVKANLPPELQWMAPAIAAASGAAATSATAPIVKRTQDTEAAARAREWDELADELTQSAPGWEAHEKDMTELLAFLQSPSMRDKRFGSKLSLLHRLVTGDAAATATAVRRIGEAARGRTVTGQSGRSTAPNVHEQVRNAPSNAAAWDIAAKAAIEEARAKGLAV